MRLELLYSDDTSINIDVERLWLPLLQNGASHAWSSHNPLLPQFEQQQTSRLLCVQFCETVVVAMVLRIACSAVALLQVPLTVPVGMPLRVSTVGKSAENDSSAFSIVMRHGMQLQSEVRVRIACELVRPCFQESAFAGIAACAARIWDASPCTTI